jgi:mannosyltransferase
LNIDGKRSGALLAVILTIALGLRLFHLGERVVWFDEANSLLIASAKPSQIVDAVIDDVHTPFYYLTLRWWQCAFRGEVGARLLSVFAGVATVAVVYALGSAWAGRAAGLLGAALLSLCPLHIWYSQEIRMYALQTLLVSLSFLFLLRALRDGRITLWAGYSLFTALSLYAQYTSLFAIVAQGLFVLIGYRQKLRAWLLAQCVVVLLFAPCLHLLLSQTTRTIGESWLPPLEIGRLLAFFSLFSGAYLGDPHARLPSIAITVAVIIVASAILLRRRETRPMATPLLLWFCVPVILLALQSLGHDHFLPRVLVYTAPALALLVGCAAIQPAGTASRVTVVASVAVLLVANLYALHRYYFSENAWIKSDLRSAANDLTNEFHTGDIILHTSESSYRPFEYYLGRDVAQGVVTPPKYLSHLFHVTGDGQLPKSTTGFNRIWLVLYPDQFHPDLAEQTRDWMNHHHNFVRPLYDSATVFVGLYDRRDPQLTPASE